MLKLTKDNTILISKDIVSVLINIINEAKTRPTPLKMSDVLTVALRLKDDIISSVEIELDSPNIGGLGGKIKFNYNHALEKILKSHLSVVCKEDLNMSIEAYRRTAYVYLANQKVISQLSNSYPKNSELRKDQVFLIDRQIIAYRCIETSDALESTGLLSDTPYLIDLVVSDYKLDQKITSSERVMVLKESKAVGITTIDGLVEDYIKKHKINNKE